MVRRIEGVQGGQAVGITAIERFDPLPDEIARLHTHAPPTNLQSQAATNAM